MPSILTNCIRKGALFYSVRTEHRIIFCTNYLLAKQDTKLSSMRYISLIGT